MFLAVSESAPALIELSNSVRDNVLIHGIVVVFFMRLIYLQVTVGSAEEYKQLIKDLIFCNLFLYLAPLLIEPLTQIPDLLFTALEGTPLKISIEDAPVKAESEGVLGLKLKDIAHMVWIVVFYLIYIVWMAVYSVAIALGSFVLFLGTICARRALLAKYISIMIIMMCFPVIWIVFDQALEPILTKNEIGRAVSIIGIYILKIYVTIKAGLGIYESAPVQGIKNGVLTTGKVGGFVGKHAAKVPGIKQGLEAGSTLVDNAQHKWEGVKTQRQIKPNSQELDSNSVAFTGVTKPVVNSSSGVSMPQISGVKSPSKLAQNLASKEKATRLQTRAIRIKNFGQVGIAEYKNPQKAYGFSSVGEVSSLEMSSEEIAKAKNLTGYSQVSKSPTIVYNPEGNFLYEKGGMKKNWSIDRKANYSNQIASFNSHLKGENIRYKNNYRGLRKPENWNIENNFKEEVF